MRSIAQRSVAKRSGVERSGDTESSTDAARKRLTLPDLYTSPLTTLLRGVDTTLLREVDTTLIRGAALDSASTLRLCRKGGFLCAELRGLELPRPAPNPQSLEINSSHSDSHI